MRAGTEGRALLPVDMIVPVYLVVQYASPATWEDVRINVLIDHEE